MPKRKVPITNFDIIQDSTQDPLERIDSKKSLRLGNVYVVVCIRSFLELSTL